MDVKLKKEYARVFEIAVSKVHLIYQIVDQGCGKQLFFIQLRYYYGLIRYWFLLLELLVLNNATNSKV